MALTNRASREAVSLYARCCVCALANAGVEVDKFVTVWTAGRAE
jgi:hypothetical protein